MPNLRKITLIFDHPTDSNREFNVEVEVSKTNFDVVADFNPSGNLEDFMGHLFDNGEIPSVVWDRPKVAR